MSNTVCVGEWWDDTQAGYRLVNEGRYNVAIKSARPVADNRVRVTYQILDRGRFCNWHLYETFCLDNDIGQSAFKEFSQILGIAPQNGDIDLESFAGKGLEVTVRHKEEPDGKTWVNVTAHHPSERDQ